MLISVVVPIRNETPRIKKLLDQLRNQNLCPDEVIFVDAASGDKPLEIIRSYSGRVPFSMHVEAAGHSYPGRSRNIGLRISKSVWIAFMDIGIDFDPEWLERMMKIAENQEADVVLGCCDFFGESWIQDAICSLSYGLGSKHETVPGSVVRRETLLSKKVFFPENLRAAEDLIWKKEIRKKTKWAKESQPTLHYRSFPSTVGSYLNKRLVYAAHEARGGYHTKYLTLFFAWILMPLVLLGLGLSKYALIWICIIFLLRGVVDPFRRSPSFKASVIFLTPWLACLGDLFGVKGYLDSIFGAKLPGDE